MTGTVVAILVYLLGGILWSRIYYARRHGLGWGVDLGAVIVGMAWPITVFTHWHPDLCRHQSCVLARASAQEEYDRNQQAYQRALDQERRQ